MAWLVTGKWMKVQGMLLILLVILIQEPGMALVLPTIPLESLVVRVLELLNNRSSTIEGFDSVFLCHAPDERIISGKIIG